MVRSGLTAALCGALATMGITGTAGAADPAPTIWPGWQAVGDTNRIGALDGVLASDGTVLRIAAGFDSRSRAFVLDDGTRTRVGVLPYGTPGQGPGGRLVLSDGCTVRHSDDRGATWSDVVLPGCTLPYDERPVAAFAPDGTGLVTTTVGTWGSADGGATWTRRSGPPIVPATVTGQGVAPLVLGGGVALRVLRTTSDAPPLERTVDGGATWQPVDLPPAPPIAPVAGRAPVVPTPTPPVRRADGAVVVGTDGALLVSTDGGATFARTPLPDAVGGPLADPVAVLCDPVVVSCIVGLASSGTTRAVRFSDGAFSGPLPGLPGAAGSPAAGVVVGIENGSTKALQRSDDGGATYATTGGEILPGDFGDRGLLAVTVGDRVRTSTDGGATWQDLPAPPVGFDERPRYVRDGAALLALTGRALLRWDGTRWSTVADLSGVGATDVGVLDGRPLVVGSQGIVLVLPGGRLRPVSAPVLAGRGWSGVEVRGRQVVVYAPDRIARSADGGRRWRTVTGTPGGGADDVQLLDARTTLALRGRTLYRATDGSSRLRFRGVASRVAGRDGGPSPALDFSDARRGTLRTQGGAFRTGDGGRSFVPVPVPTGEDPVAVAPSGSGILVRRDRSALVLRASAAGTVGRPTLAARLSGTPRSAPKRRRRVTIAGTLRGAPAGSKVVLVTYGSVREEGVPSASVVVNADGTFRRSVLLSRSERLVRAWYAGAVTTGATTPATSSRSIAVPALRQARRTGR